MNTSPTIPDGLPQLPAFNFEYWSDNKPLPDGYCWKCPDCNSRATLPENAGYHAHTSGHGVPLAELVPAPAPGGAVVPQVPDDLEGFTIASKAVAKLFAPQPGESPRVDAAEAWEPSCHIPGSTSFIAVQKAHVVGVARQLERELATAKSDAIAQYDADCGCPEDVGCKELIASLRKQLAAQAAVAEGLREERDRFKAAIENCLAWANGRESEWGDRAVSAFAFLEAAMNPEAAAALATPDQGPK